MAKAPSWIEKVNFIVNFIINSCSYPIVVYVETAKPAVGNLVLSLLAFGMDDIIRGYFKPKGLRSGRHGRKRNRKKIGRSAIPELGEIIGKNLPGAEDVSSRKVSDGVKTLWIVDGQLQRLLYFWMIRDLVTDFAYDWISGVIRDDRTQCEGIGRAMRSNPTAGVLGILFWNPIEVEIPHYQEGDVSLGVFTGNVGHGKWFVTFSMTAWRIAAGPAVTWARLDASGPAGDSTAYSTRQVLEQGQQAGHIASMMVTGPASIVWQAGGGDGNYTALEPTVFVMGGFE